MVERRSSPVPSREVPLGQLLQRIAEEGTALCEAQIGMAFAELARDVEGQIRRLRVVLGAMLLVMSGLQLVVVAVVLAVATRLDGWLATFLVSVPLLVAGVIVLMKARSPAGASFLQETRDELKEDRRWLSALGH